MYIFIPSFPTEGQPDRTGHRGETFKVGPFQIINGLITPINTLLIGVISPQLKLVTGPTLLQFFVGHVLVAK